MKSAEETKARVDGELKDLETTLKDIETARPFEDLTVVGTQMKFSGMLVGMLIFVCVLRTKLWRHVQISRLGQNSLYQRGFGCPPATR